jgi:GT2 family glycosyltransferase
VSGFDHVLGITVVDYHTPDDLQGFIESLLDSGPQPPYALCISVVDGTELEALKASELAELTSNQGLVSSTTVHSTNVGYARACNDGADWLSLIDSIDTYAFFNSDTRITPGVLKSCVELLHSDDTYGVCGPRQVDDNGRITHAGIFGTLDKPSHRGWHQPAGQKFQDVRDDAVTVSGSAYFIKRTLWDELHHCPIYKSIDPDSFGAFLQTPLYFEETWCSYHAQAHQKKVVYNGEATMIHRWHKSIAIHGDHRWFWESKSLFVDACDKHGIAHD